MESRFPVPALLFLTKQGPGGPNLFSTPARRGRPRFSPDGESIADLRVGKSGASSLRAGNTGPGGWSTWIVPISGISALPRNGTAFSPRADHDDAQ